MTRRYTTRGEWIALHGEEVKRLWRDTDMTCREIGQLFGVSKSAVGSFMARSAVTRSYITSSVMAHFRLPVRGLDTSNIDAELSEISQYRHDTRKMLSCAARICGMPVSELTEPNVRAGAKLKWRATYLMRRIGLSYPRIGKLVNRDHSTVQYGVKRFQATVDANKARDAALRSHVEAA
jgi:IS30 family transposase